MELSATEVAKLAGLSLSMVNYLERTRVLSVGVGRKGVRRRYDECDLATLTLTRVLLDSGLAIARWKSAIHACRGELRRCPRAKWSGRVLVLCGQDAFLIEAAALAAVVMSKKKSAQLVVEVDSLVS